MKMMMVDEEEQKDASALHAPPLAESARASTSDDSHDAAVTTEQMLDLVAGMKMTDAHERSGRYSGPATALSDGAGDNRLMPQTTICSNHLLISDAPDSSRTTATLVGTMLYDEPDNHENADFASREQESPLQAYPLEYAGPWQAGRWHGDDGHLQYRNGDTYQGSFWKGQRHGMGTMKWKASRQQYSGQYQNDLREGQGSFAWPDGAVYQGRFQRNQRSGHGNYHAPTVSYHGEWKDGAYHGRGIYKYQQAGHNYTFTGQFRNGKPHGKGIPVGGSKGDVVEHDGTWRDGQPLRTDIGIKGETASGENERKEDTNNIVVVQNQEWKDLTTGDWATYRGLWDKTLQCPVGSGSLNFKGGLFLAYEGCFTAPGHFHGDGRLHWRNGDVYEGNFVLGDRQGHGRYRWADGRTYHGEFQKNLRHGHGRFVYPNNDFYEGHFEGAKRHGNGRFVFADGSQYEGEWKDGRYNGTGTLVQHDGRMYTGEFQAGVAHGRGRETTSAGCVIYDGLFVLGQPASQMEVANAVNGHVYQGHDFDGPIVDVDFDMSDLGPRLEPESDSEQIADRKIIPAEHSETAIVSENPAKTSFEAISAPHLLRVWTPSGEPPSEVACEAVVDEVVSDTHGDIGRFTGIISKDTRVPHGVGRMVYADGRRIYEGFWKDGGKEGHGRCLFTPQGDFHEGTYCKNMRHGLGRYVWKDGRSFVGSYMNDLRHGHGVFVYPSGDRYEGSFAQGMRSGKGRFEFDNGTGMYDGEWAGGKYHGEGYLTWREHNGGHFSYKGQFTDGLFHGAGVKMDASGRILEEGNWSCGQSQSQSMYNAADSSRRVPVPGVDTESAHGNNMHEFVSPAPEESLILATSDL